MFLSFKSNYNQPNLDSNGSIISSRLPYQTFVSLIGTCGKGSVYFYPRQQVQWRTLVLTLTYTKHCWCCSIGETFCLDWENKGTLHAMERLLTTLWETWAHSWVTMRCIHGHTPRWTELSYHEMHEMTWTHSWVTVRCIHGRFPPWTELSYHEMHEIADMGALLARLR